MVDHPSTNPTCLSGLIYPTHTLHTSHTQKRSSLSPTILSQPLHCMAFYVSVPGTQNTKSAGQQASPPT